MTNSFLASAASQSKNIYAWCVYIGCAILFLVEMQAVRLSVFSVSNGYSPVVSWAGSITFALFFQLIHLASFFGGIAMRMKGVRSAHFQALAWSALILGLEAFLFIPHIPTVFEMNGDTAVMIYSGLGIVSAAIWYFEMRLLNQVQFVGRYDQADLMRLAQMGQKFLEERGFDSIPDALYQASQNKSVKQKQPAKSLKGKSETDTKKKGALASAAAKVGNLIGG